MLQAWLSPWVGLVLAVMLMVTGVSLLLGGARQLRSMPAHWGWLAACCAAGLCTVLWFGVMAPSPRWRIGLLSLLLAFLSLLVTRTTLGESRPQHQAGMRLLALLGVVFAVLMGMRSLAAVLGLVDSSVSNSLVNTGSVLASGMALIGGVVGLVLVLSGELMALLQHQREHDSLTNLLNRVGLRQWIGAQAPQQALALGMVDLDQFKQINDRHGHSVGDQVIQHLAVMLHASESPVCRSARLGGGGICRHRAGAKRRRCIEPPPRAIASSVCPKWSAARFHLERRVGIRYGSDVRSDPAPGGLCPLPRQSGWAQPVGASN